jgi:hypothetical protein
LEASVEPGQPELPFLIDDGNLKTEGWRDAILRFSI